MQARTRRLNRPMLRSAKAIGLSANRTDNASTPLRWGVFTGSAASLNWGGITAGTTVNSATVIYTQWDWLSAPITLTAVITASTGAVPSMTYKLNTALNVTGSSFTVTPNDNLRLALQSSNGLACTGTVSWSGRPELGSFTYSFT